MTVEEEEVKALRNVVVGIRFDGQARELLDWALVKVADPGDCIIALHICKKSDSISKAQAILDGYLDDYEEICNQKQVRLAVEVVQGSSIRKLLVKEAKALASVALLLGINKHSPLGCKVSVAKYCAKRLPSTTEIMAIYNGKVVYRRSSDDHLSGSYGDPKPSLCPIIRECQSEIAESEISDMGRLSHDYGSTEMNGNAKDEALISAIERRKRNSLSSISLPVEDFTHQRPGWPLLQTASRMTTPSLEARKLSVVQWVLSLPNRSLLEVPQSKSLFLNEAENSSTGIIPIHAYLPEHLELLLKTKPAALCKVFSHEFLKNATSQFSSENLIGEGGSNRVYKGVLPDGKSVAVKISKSSKETWKQFSQEVDIMTALKHRNISPLLGICVADKDLISVYDLLPKGNLEQNLHGNNEKSALPWEVRFNIAIGIAQALNYIHNECPRPIIHRDVKSSNILLDDMFNPQLSDFGLAIWGPPRASFITDSDVVGTFGYLAPEYFMYGKVSDKVDVYSFGVVLLELLSGKEPIGFQSSKGQESLVMWAKPKLEGGDFKSILDQDLNSDMNEEEMERMVVAAKLCLTQAARLRPNMNQILELLTGEKDLNEMIMDLENQELDNDNDDEVYPDSSAESHLSLALLDVNDISTSFSSSLDQSSSSPLSIEGYLRRRWSRASSLD